MNALQGYDAHGNHQSEHRCATDCQLPSDRPSGFHFSYVSVHVILLSSHRSYMASIPTLLSMAAAEFTLPGSTESSLQKICGVFRCLRQSEPDPTVTD
jgi:hypothetical protein